MVIFNFKRMTQSQFKKEVKEQIEQINGKPKTVKCLCCTRKFQTRSKGHRVCWRCKKLRNLK